MERYKSHQVKVPIWCRAMLAAAVGSKVTNANLPALLCGGAFCQDGLAPSAGDSKHWFRKEKTQSWGWGNTCSISLLVHCGFAPVFLILYLLCLGRTVVFSYSLPLTYGTGSGHQLERLCGDRIVPKYWSWMVRGCDTIIFQLPEYLIVALENSGEFQTCFALQKFCWWVSCYIGLPLLLWHLNVCFCETVMNTPQCSNCSSLSRTVKMKADSRKLQKCIMTYWVTGW